MAAALLAERVVLSQLERIRELPYERYCNDLLGLELSSGQRSICRTLFDGQRPNADDGDRFFGGDIAPDSFALRVVAAICGRGSGKSKVFLAARALHLALRVRLDGVSPNDPPSLVAVVAPSQRQSRQTVAFVRGYLEDRPILKKILKAECLADTVRITRLDGKKVNIEARPATSGGDSVRGPKLVAVLMEESAFFEGEGYEVNDTEIFRAARPRLEPDGQIIFASSPWAQAGKLWELYRDNFGKPDSAVVCKAPTLLVRPSEDTRRAYESELKNDPDNARREYDAEFLSADSERFFPEAVIEKALDRTLSVPLEIRGAESVCFGADFAFASDSSALVGFVEREGVLVCCDVDEQRPAPDLALVPSQVVGRFAERMRRAGCRLLVADDHYREAVQEHLSYHGVALAGIGNTPAHHYVLARTLMAQGRVRIPANARLLAQLRRVRATLKPGGVITIQQPRAKDGGHGDLVSAMVCALSGVSTETSFPKPGPKNETERLNRKAAADQEERLRANEKRMKLEANKRYGRLGMAGLLKRSRLWKELSK